MSRMSKFAGELFRFRSATSRRRRRSSNARSRIEQLERRYALAVTVSGTKWLDVNYNGIRDNDLIQGDAPDVVFVVDVSLSTLAKFDGTAVGDVNGDGTSNDILDASLAGFIALNRQLNSVPGIGSRARVGLVAFAATGEIIDMDPQSPGVQIFARPSADSDGNSVLDVEQALRGIRRELGGQINGGSTNYEAALKKATAVFDTLQTAGPQGNLVFLSDGKPNAPSTNTADYADEVKVLRDRGYNLRAFGAKTADVELAPLRVIDPVVAGSRPGAAIFATTDELVGAFSGLRGDSLRYTEPGLAGVEIYLDLNDNGKWDGFDETKVTSRSDDPATTNVDETGTYTLQLSTLPSGTYRIREVIPTGYIHTSLGTLTIPDPANASQTIRNQADGSWLLNIPAGGSRTNIDFGNAPGSISGVKYRDVNGDGIRNASLVVGTSPDVVFVIDVSGSTDASFGGSSVGDVNGDGSRDTILDAELAGFIALNQQLVTQGLGSRARVSIVLFGDTAATVDMNPASGAQGLVVTSPSADTDNNGVRDVEQILRGVRKAGTADGSVSVGQSTNYKAALSKTDEVFASLATPSGQGNMVFLSDGGPNDRNYATEVGLLRARGANLRAFGAGTGAVLAPLQDIDPKAAIFKTTDELNAAFGTPQGTTSSVVGFSEPGWSGVKIYIDSNDNRQWDAGEPITDTRADDPATTSVDESGSYTFNNLSPGTYIVREIAPTGSIQTSGGSQRGSYPWYQGDTGYECTISTSSPRATGIDFGNFPGGGSITGVKWRDDNGNGIRDGGLIIGDDPDVVFVIDVSSSTNSAFIGTDVGDVNNDSASNTVLDAELRGFIDLNKRLIAQGYGASSRVSIVIFAGAAVVVPLTGGGTTAAPAADRNSNGTPDIEETLQQIVVNGVRGGPTVTDGTNYSVGLGTTLTVLNSLNSPAGQANVVFLSDGQPNAGDGTAEAAALRNRGANLRAFGAGSGADLTALKKLDPAAAIFRTSDELIQAFGGLQGAGRAAFVEPGLAGVTIYIDLNNNGVKDANEPSTVTAADNPATPNVDEAGSYSFSGLGSGTYVVREVVPQGYVLSSKGTLGGFTYDWNGKPTNNKSNESSGAWTVKLGWDPSVSIYMGGYDATGYRYPATATGVDFGNAPPAEIRGMKWLDIDGDGVRDVCYDTKSIVFAIDVSGSTWNQFVGCYVGDPNGDGKPNTILDGEIAAVLDMHRDLMTGGDIYGRLLEYGYHGNQAVVSVIVYGSTAAALDLDPATPGVQATIQASADANRNGVADFVEAVQAIREGHGGVGVGTNFEAALQRAAAVAPIGSRLVFLADGEPTTGSSLTDELAALDAKAVTRRAYGVGGLSVVGQPSSALRQIDPNSGWYSSCADLMYAIEMDGCVTEPGISGVTVYADVNGNGALDENERPFSAVTREDDPATLADEAGSYVISGLTAGTYTVREVVPAGYLQTFPQAGHSVTIGSTGRVLDKNFGNQPDPRAPFVQLPWSGPVVTGGGPARLIDPFATLIDLDSETLSGGRMTVTVVQGSAAALTLGIREATVGGDAVRMSGSSVTVNGIAIGTVSGGSAGAPLVISFNANATPRTAQALLRSVQVAATSQVTSGNRVAAVSVIDDTNRTSIERRKTIQVGSPAAAPAVPVVVSGNGQAALSWTAPTNNGGLTITDYVVEFKKTTDASWARFNDGVSANTTANVTGLTNGTAYVFRVSAVNAAGTGLPSAASAAVSPTRFRASLRAVDLNGDGITDAIWESTAGQVVGYIYDAQGRITQTRSIGGSSALTIETVGDFDGNGVTDIVWRTVASGVQTLWLMQATGAVASTRVIGGDLTWRIESSGDYNGDGRTDLIWRGSATGVNILWLMNGATATSTKTIGGDLSWRLVATGADYDSNGDGSTDLIWRTSAGANFIWRMQGVNILSTVGLGGSTDWQIVGTGDFDGDGKHDLLWRNTAGVASLWLMNDGVVRQTQTLVSDALFVPVVLVDVNNDGRSDIVWRTSAGASIAWLMNGSVASGSVSLGGNTTWQILRRPGRRAV